MADGVFSVVFRLQTEVEGRWVWKIN